MKALDMASPENLMIATVKLFNSAEHKIRRSTNTEEAFGYSFAISGIASIVGGVLAASSSAIVVPATQIAVIGAICTVAITVLTTLVARIATTAQINREVLRSANTISHILYPSVALFVTGVIAEAMYRNTGFLNFTIGKDFIGFIKNTAIGFIDIFKGISN
jgi:hypothetical protein